MELGLDSGIHMIISHQSMAGSCDHGSSRNWVVLSKIILLSLPKIGIRTAVLSFCSETQDKVNSGSSSGMSLCIDTELMTILRGSMHRGWKAQTTGNCREIRPERLIMQSVLNSLSLWTQGRKSKHVLSYEQCFLKQKASDFM